MTINHRSLNVWQDLLSVGANPVDQAVLIKVTLVGEGQAGHRLLQLLHEVERVSLKVIPLFRHHLEQVALKVSNGGQRLHLEALPCAVNQGSLPWCPLQPEADTTGEDLRKANEENLNSGPFSFNAVQMTHTHFKWHVAGD